MKIRLWPVVTLLGIAAISFAGCGGGGGGGGEGADQTPPGISNTGVAPVLLRFPGGAVVITATVTDASGVEWVEATVTGPNRATVPVRLTSEGNNLYRGTFPAPANPHSDGKADVYTVHLRARDKAKTPNETPSPGEKADDFQVNAPESPPEKPPTF